MLDSQEKMLIKSEGYATLANCLVDILLLRLLIQKDFALDQHFERLTTSEPKRKENSGRHQRLHPKYYFAFKDHDHIIGTSESFANEDDLERDIRNVQELASKAMIQYLP